MALLKRGKWWWTDFTVNGARYRQSLETTDWREAQAREKEKIVQASAGVLSAANQQFSRPSFAVAADRYLEDQEPHLAIRSIVTARERLKPIENPRSHESI